MSVQIFLGIFFAVLIVKPNQNSGIKAAAVNSCKNKRSRITGTVLIDKLVLQLECAPMPNVMAAQPNIGGSLCEGSIIDSLYHATKFD